MSLCTRRENILGYPPRVNEQEKRTGKKRKTDTFSRPVSRSVGLAERTNWQFAASGPHGLEIDWLTPSTRVLQSVSGVSTRTSLAVDHANKLKMLEN